MSIISEQSRFLSDIALTILYANRLGYSVTAGDFWAHPEDGRHTDNSRHYMRMAADLNLFLGNQYLDDTEAHQPIGEFWESLDPKNRWGGRWNDGNHYERIA